MRVHRSLRLGAGVCAAAGFLLLALGTVARSGASDEQVYSAAAGAVTYRTYCANCHGTDARGEGYIAPALREKPSDLTRLAADNGGVFPAERVRKSIDGQDDVRAHGTREMPIWGDIFLWPEKDSPERRELVVRKIGELVAHLRTIQAPVEKR
jgi:mono/diheme cytochrome c family protein